jgi:hypothetical protein
VAYGLTADAEWAPKVVQFARRFLVFLYSFPKALKHTLKMAHMPTLKSMELRVRSIFINIKDLVFTERA